MPKTISFSYNELIESIALIPGSGEFVYAPYPVHEEYTLTKAYICDQKLRWHGKVKNIYCHHTTSYSRPVNMHTRHNVSDAYYATQQMLESLPNLKHVSVVVNWFITSEKAGLAEVLPKVERNQVHTPETLIAAAERYDVSIRFEGITPRDWAVGNYTRGTAPETLRLFDISTTDKLKHGYEQYGLPIDDLTGECARELANTTYAPRAITDRNDVYCLLQHYSPETLTGSTLLSDDEKLTSELDRFNLIWGRSALTYGGTPSDDSIMALLKHLTQKGLKVTFYPMPLVDTIIPEPKPWRGRIKPETVGDARQFFRRERGYNSFIQHYVELTQDGQKLLDYVDSFVMGSEMIGMSSHATSPGEFPGADELLNLAQVIHPHMQAHDVKLVYAADWSEYHHAPGGYYPLDGVWNEVDVIGIDYYMPLTPDLPQANITREAIAAGLTSGEGWSHYWDHERQQQYPLAPTWAWKNTQHWWGTEHYQPDGTKTAWQPGSKPIWLTEVGFPSLDGATNQPNVFYDPDSIESFFPRGSEGKTDFSAQQMAIYTVEASMRNNTCDEATCSLYPRRFLWAYDARPFPHYPGLQNVWADGRLWEKGHWIQGKNTELLDVRGTNQTTVLGTEEDDTVFGSSLSNDIDTGAGNDIVYAGNEHDRIFLGTGHDQVFAGEGNDHVRGNPGNDEVFGGPGNDELFGNEGDDYLDGGTGHDRLAGGAGNNILRGGPGNDQFLVIPNPGATDTILDFESHNEGELIDLSDFPEIDSIEKMRIEASENDRDVIISLPNEQRIIIKNIKPEYITATSFSFYLEKTAAIYQLTDEHANTTRFLANYRSEHLNVVDMTQTGTNIGNLYRRQLEGCARVIADNGMQLEVLGDADQFQRQTFVSEREVRAGDLPSYFEYNMVSELAYRDPKTYQNILNKLQSARYGWQLLSDSTQVGLPDSSYYGQSYVNHKTKQIIIGSRGTTGRLIDLVNDALLAVNVVPQSVAHAQTFYENVKFLRDSDYAGYEISFTGHSLGAFTSQVVAINNRHNSVTFENPGIAQVAELLTGDPSASKHTVINAPPNVINTSGGQIGEVLLMPFEVAESVLTFPVDMIARMIDGLAERYPNASPWLQNLNPENLLGLVGRGHGNSNMLKALDPDNKYAPLPIAKQWRFDNIFEGALYSFVTLNEDPATFTGLRKELFDIASPFISDDWDIEFGPLQPLANTLVKVDDIFVGNIEGFVRSFLVYKNQQGELEIGGGLESLAADLILGGDPEDFIEAYADSSVRNIAGEIGTSALGVTSDNIDGLVDLAKIQNPAIASAMGGFIGAYATNLVGSLLTGFNIKDIGQHFASFLTGQAFTALGEMAATLLLGPFLGPFSGIVAKVLAGLMMKYLGKPLMNAWRFLGRVLGEVIEFFEDVVDYWKDEVIGPSIDVFTYLLDGDFSAAIHSFARVTRSLITFPVGLLKSVFGFQRRPLALLDSPFLPGKVKGYTWKYHNGVIYIDYTFLPQALMYRGPYMATGSGAELTEDVQDFIREQLSHIEQFTPFRFSEAPRGNNASLVLVAGSPTDRNATVARGVTVNYELSPELLPVNTTDEYTVRSEIMLNSDASFADLIRVSLHEIMHALGVFPADYDMSRDWVSPKPSEIQQLQTLYGRNDTRDTSDDVYFLSPGLGAVIDDRGGVNTLTAHNLTSPVFINLNASIAESSGESPGVLQLMPGSHLQRIIGGRYESRITVIQNETLVAFHGNNTLEINGQHNRLVIYPKTGVDTVTGFDVNNNVIELGPVLHQQRKTLDKFLSEVITSNNNGTLELVISGQQVLRIPGVSNLSLVHFSAYFDYLAMLDERAANMSMSLLAYAGARKPNQTVATLRVFDEDTPRQHLKIGLNNADFTVVNDSVVYIGEETHENTVVNLTVRDPANNSHTVSITFFPSLGNQPPRQIGQISDLDLSSGEVLELDVSAYFRDPDGDTLQFSSGELPDGVTLSQQGLFRCPVKSDFSGRQIPFNVSDGLSSVASFVTLSVATLSTDEKNSSIGSDIGAILGGVAGGMLLLLTLLSLYRKLRHPCFKSDSSSSTSSQASRPERIGAPAVLEMSGV